MGFCNSSTRESAAGTGEASGTRSADPLIPNPQSPIPPSPSAFRLQIDPPAAGAWNMAVDEALLEAAATKGQPTLRFYQWQEPTLSLGYFQEYEDRRLHEASAGCPTVRRSSGGGAILHDRELTYSLAVPEGHPLVADRLRTYRVIHESLIETLSDWGIEATLYTCGMADADRKHSQSGAAVPLGRQPFLCFQRRSLGDVLAGGVKIAGSAQRRRRGAVLQHGSVLLARSAAAQELDGLEERTGKLIAADKLIEAWSARLAEVLTVEWSVSALSGDDQCRAAALDSEKYSTAAWTKNRGRR